MKNGETFLSCNFYLIVNQDFNDKNLTESN